MHGAAPRRTVWVALGALGLLVCLLTGRMLHGAHSQLARAKAARAADRSDLEAVHLRRALAYYVPGNPWVDQAVDRLTNLAREAEASGRSNEALETWRALRSGIVGLRGLWQPHGDRLPLIHERIVALTGRQATAAASLRTQAGAEALRRRLANPEEPHRVWTALALLGFVLWLGASLLLIFGGITSQAGTGPRHFGWLLGLVAISMALFWGSLAQATGSGATSVTPLLP